MHAEAANAGDMCCQTNALHEPQLGHPAWMPCLLLQVPWPFTDTDFWEADLTAGEGLVLFVILSLLHSLQQLASKGGITYTTVQNITDLM